MKTTNARTGGPYDEYYASLYDSIWGKSTIWQAEAKFHLETISGLLRPDAKWLDAGCGTGFLLSQFPEARRVGFDLSPAMLKEAQKANPSAEAFHQLNLMDEKPEWINQWDLVTCTGQPWSYLPTLEAIEKVVGNLAKWTSKNGYCMLTPIDISDFMQNQLPVFYDTSHIPNEFPVITGILWSYKELDTIDHNCLSPNLDQWVRWFSRYFHKVEIVRWPHEPSFLVIPRRVIVCSEKKEMADEKVATIIEHPIPNASTPQPLPINSIVSSLSHKQLLSELASRIRSGSLFQALKRKIFS